jgi:lipoprotein signal peptidase
MEFIKFINTYNGFFMLIATIILIGVTVYYAVQTKHQVNKAEESVAETRKQNENMISKNLTIKNNYLFLIYSEIEMNLKHYLIFLLHMDTDLTGLNININEIRLCLLYKPTFNKVKGMAFSHISNSTWLSINTESAKYLTNELMLQLTSYYIGISNLMLYTKEEVSDKRLVNYLKGQIINTCRCINLLDKESTFALRKSNTYVLDKYEANINFENGDIEWTSTSEKAN